MLAPGLGPGFPDRERIPLSAAERKLWDNEWILGFLLTLLVLEWIGRKAIRLM